MSDATDLFLYQNSRKMISQVLITCSFFSLMKTWLKKVTYQYIYIIYDELKCCFYINYLLSNRRKKRKRWRHLFGLCYIQESKPVQGGNNNGHNTPVFIHQPQCPLLLSELWGRGSSSPYPPILVRFSSRSATAFSIYPYAPISFAIKQ